MTFPDLDPRSEAVLKTLIETYLVEGEPVGSRLLSKRYPEALSSASIRNVLVDLEEGEFLSQPHTSAGRIPTERGYRWYVDRWVRPHPPGPELGARLAEVLEPHSQDFEAWVRHAARVLSEVLQGVCVALPRRLSRSRLVKLEFVPLGSNRVVAVWVGQAGDVEHQVMDNLWGFDPTTLTELGNFATLHFTGCTLGDLRKRLYDTLKDQSEEAHRLTEKLGALTKGMQDPASAEDPPVVVAGLGRLGQIPEFEDLQRFRSLVAAFEEHERLARLLNAFADAAAREITLLLGSENPYLPSMPLATALSTVPFGQKDCITFAMVGPLRMDYARLLGGLTWWSGELSRRNPWAQLNQ
ncbi:MAG: heat-inducible transcription repressor HrcA [Acidobacteria bacterium]|nr:heat-inducible transcription repressor HrcA [Acidobacteriota bacterium]